jgi:membrane-bound serine protease (ClpP class)
MDMCYYKTRVVILLTAFLLIGLFTGSNLVAEQSSLDIANLPEQTVVVIPCKGMIDDGLYKSIQRRTSEAIEMGATYLIYEIQTYGGILKSGDDISKYLILDVGKKHKTVAYITSEAISAGAMISVACQDIIMLENTTIGDCAPIVMGGKLEGVEREKVESFTRVAFSRAAEANNYPEPLLKAMVTRQLEVYRVKNYDTGEYEFFETKELPTEEIIYDVENKKLVVTSDELLTLTSQQAEEFGIARKVVKDFDGVLSFLSERDGVKFSQKRIELKTNWSEEMVRWINSPVVMTILVMLALLGVYVELHTPGLGLPGLLAVICVVIIVGSKYLIGMANWVEVAIFVLGLILLLIELLVIPGFGVTGLAGILCIFTGLFGMLVKNAPDQIPWPQGELGWAVFTEGVLSLLAGFLCFSALAYFLAKFLPKFQFMGGLILSPPDSAGKVKIKMPISRPQTSPIVTVEVGSRGRVISALRPAGWAQFDQTKINVVAQAQFLEVGTEVQIVHIEGNKIIVQKVESEK